MKKCKKCGYRNSDSANYCRKCGSSLADLGQKEKQQKKSARSHRLMKTAGIVLLLAVLYVGFCMLTGREILPFQKNSQEGTNRYYSDDLYFMETSREDLKQGTNGVSFVKNQLIVTADRGVSKGTVEKLVKEADGEIVGCIRKANIYQIEFGKDISVDELAQKKSQLESQSAVKNVRTNDVIRFFDADKEDSVKYPNDKNWDDQWSSDPDGGNWYLEAIHAPEAWKYIEEKDTKKVDLTAMEGTPANEDHEDLKDNFTSNPVYNRNIQGNTEENNSHATSVVGIMGAGFNNGVGIAGVVPKVNLDVAALSGIENEDSDSGESDGTLMSVESTLAYLVEKYGKDQTVIINVSQSMADTAFSASRGEQEAIDYLTEFNNELADLLDSYLDQGYDFLIVKGAGNSNDASVKDFIKADEGDKNAVFGYLYTKDESRKDACKKYEEQSDYEERLDGGNVDAQYDFLSGITKDKIKNRIVVVGAVGMKEGNKGYEVCAFSNGGSRVDIVAPGAGMDVLGYEGYESNGSGTSFAAPCAAGVAGLQLSLYPTVTGAQLKYLLVDSSKGSYSGYLNGKKFNYRMIDAYHAVERADHIKKYTPFITDRSTPSGEVNTEDQASDNGNDNQDTGNGSFYNSGESTDYDNTAESSEQTTTEEKNSQEDQTNSSDGVNIAAYTGTYQKIYPVSGKVNIQPTYSVIINKVTTNNVKFQIEFFGINGSPIYQTKVMTAKLENGKTSFQWEDTWGNEGNGTIIFYKNYLKLKMVQTKTAKNNRSTLAKSKDYMKLEKKSNNTKVNEW